MNFITRIIKRTVLKNFYQIPLTAFEQSMADDAVNSKYRRALVQSFLFSLLLVPALLLLDTSVVMNVLIPTTMVAGTAWFSVSLASMKQKFENFGMELTTDLFIAFTLSLMMLFLAACAALTKNFWWQHIEPYSEMLTPSFIAALLAIFVVAKLLFSIFSGSLKYDVNDAMLTGQNEAAEKFFKKSLSVLHSTSESLKIKRELQVANYSLGVAFFEIFDTIRRRSSLNKDEESMAKTLIEQANKLVRTPSMPQSEADHLTRSLVKAFLHSCGEEAIIHKSFEAVEFELECLEANSSRNENDAMYENQEMVDLRMSVVLTEISALIEEFGHKIQLSGIKDLDKLLNPKLDS